MSSASLQSRSCWCRVSDAHSRSVVGMVVGRALHAVDVAQFDSPARPTVLAQEDNHVDLANRYVAKSAAVGACSDPPPLVLCAEFWTSVHVPSLETTRHRDKGHTAPVLTRALVFDCSGNTSRHWDDGP